MPRNFELTNAMALNISFADIDFCLLFLLLPVGGGGDG
jgi:hypothetical protein